MLTTSDIERLGRARRILVGRLDQAPSLAELARTVGIEQTKLEVGLRTHFGSPVPAHVRACRMEEAERLLGQRRHSVTEIAQQVGYANASKFAAAFRRYQGVSPRRR